MCCHTYCDELFLHVVIDQVDAHPLLPVEQTLVSDLVGTCHDISAGCRSRAPCRDSAHVRECRKRKHRWAQGQQPGKSCPRQLGELTTAAECNISMESEGGSPRVPGPPQLNAGTRVRLGVDVPRAL